MKSARHVSAVRLNPSIVLPRQAACCLLLPAAVLVCWISLPDHLSLSLHAARVTVHHSRATRRLVAGARTMDMLRRLLSTTSGGSAVNKAEKAPKWSKQSVNQDVLNAR